MNDQNSNNHTGVSRLPISPKRIASIRVWTDLLIVVVVFIFLSPILETTTARIVLASVTGIFAGSLFGYFLIQRGRTIIGMGFVIYGFLIGLTTIAVYVEGLGPFSIVAMLLVTVISVSYAIPIQRVIEALSAGIALGVFSLVFDINFRGAAFRLAAPPQLTSALWIITLVLVGIIFYFIARQFPFFSLRAKMITSFAVITILALAALGFLNSRSVKRVLTEEANQSLLNAAIQTEETLWQFINLNYQSIETEASLPIMAEYIYALENEEVMIEERLLDTLLALAQKDPDYISSYALLDLLGNVLADTQIDHISANEADLSFFTDTIGKNSTTISPVEIDPFTFVPSIYFGTPVVSEGQTIGVLRVRYKADILQNIITRSNNRGGENSFAVLFDENLIHLAHGIAPETIFTTVAPLGNDIFEQLLKERRLPLKTQEETFLDLPDLEKNLLKAQTSPAGMAFFEASDIATGDLINQVVVLNMQDPEWLLAFFQPQEIFLAPIDSLANNTILLGLLSGLGAVVLGIVLTQILTAPILNLTETAEEVSKGNFQAKAQISTEDEIGILGQTFNKMTIQLQNLVTNLENQVEIRTKSLRNQTAQMQASAEVARDITSEQNLQDLLNRASNLIYDRFGYYHVGIYLKDQKGDYVNLMASADQPGKRLLQAEHQFRVDTESNVGYACILGEAIIASNSEQTASIIFHPLLPNTQSQLVLPLNVGSQILGAIDLHSTNPSSFAQEDVHIFQTLADQIAIAIQKARYQEEIQATLNELEAAYSIFTRESWRHFIQARKRFSGYRYNQRNIEIMESPTQEVVKAWKDGRKVSVKKKASEESASETQILAIPLKVRGEVIGVLNIEFETDHIPDDTSELISEIADRLGLILENARLIETAEKQVEKEQLTSHISNTFRQSLDMNVVLKTAVQEIGENLGLAEVELRMGNLEQVTKPDPDKTNGKPNSDQIRD